MFSLQGEFLSAFGSVGSEHGEFRGMGQICLHPVTNHMIVADDNNHRVEIFDENGQFVYSIDDRFLYHVKAVDCSFRAPHNIVCYG